jgi:hypothetical protein
VAQYIVKYTAENKPLVDRINFPDDVQYVTKTQYKTNNREYQVEIPLKVTFWAADNVPDEPVPSAPGTKETFVIQNVPSNTTLQFAVKTWDAEQNLSDLSNVITIQSGNVGTQSIQKTDFNPGITHFPNPANPAVHMVFWHPMLQREKRPDVVSIKIFNTKGQWINQLKPQGIANGAAYISWNGRDRMGIPVSSGIYFYRVYYKGFGQTKKVTLIR